MLPHPFPKNPNIIDSPYKSRKDCILAASFFMTVPLTLLQPIPHAAHSGNELTAGDGFKLTAEMADIDLDGITSAIHKRAEGITGYNLTAA